MNRHFKMMIIILCKHFRDSMSAFLCQHFPASMFPVSISNSAKHFLQTFLCQHFLPACFQHVYQMQKSISLPAYCQYFLPAKSSLAFPASILPACSSDEGKPSLDCGGCSFFQRLFKKTRDIFRLMKKRLGALKNSFLMRL